MAVSSIGDVKTKKFWAAILAEFLGTMFLVLVACGSCLVKGTNTVQIALCFGLSVGTIVWCICHVSGGHINPAVTMGFLVTRKITLIRAFLYMAAQCVGAIVGASLLKAITPLDPITGQANNLGTSGPSPPNPLDAGQVFGVELLITFVLVWTVFASCDSQRTDLNGSAPLTIGLSIAMCHLWAVPLTGAGMNPARVFGPAVVSGTWTYHWAYWVAPLLGGALAAIIYDFIFATNATVSKTKGFFSLGYEDAGYDSKGQVPSATNPENQEMNPEKHELKPAASNGDAENPKE